mgnify:FL=1|tara:strand:- start:319 stop:786 length:468 start_codon:yes stop_codon:yes gene_type:complete
MAYREAKDVMLYFRQVKDEDNDDGDAHSAPHVSSLMIPASRLKYMGPATDTALRLTFESVKNTEGADDQADEVTVSDMVDLTVNTNSHKEAMAGIIQAINASKTGFVTVADAVTTNVAGETVAGSFIHPDITGFNAYSSDTNARGITVKVVHAGS